MKRVIILLAALIAVVLLAAAASNSTITVRPSDMKSGETKTFTDDGKTITVRRDGNAMQVTIEGAEGTRHLTITEGDGIVSIDRDGLRRALVLKDKALAMPHVARPNFPHQTWFVCPKDHTMLRVPEGKENETYKCPVDGTTMEKQKGRGFSFFFDDHMFEDLDL